MDAGTRRNLDIISTRSAREGGDPCTRRRRWRPGYFNPLRPRGRRLVSPATLTVSFLISTRSAREGGDPRAAWPTQSCGSDFNPLRPCGRRPLSAAMFALAWAFQPAPPVRAETLCLPRSRSRHRISTRSARAGGDLRVFPRRDNGQPISTRSARAGGDTHPGYMVYADRDFNPLRPCGRRPRAGQARLLYHGISTRSARAGGDLQRRYQHHGHHPISTRSARAGGDALNPPTLDMG